MPIAKPTSLSLSAGASFVPSPVTATTSPSFFNKLTSTSLSSGELRASTCRRGSSSASSAGSDESAWSRKSEYALSSVKCFSMIRAPSATASGAAAMPVVWSE